MLPAFAALLICQLAGEAIVRAAALPLPGPVAGMALLFALMIVRTPLPSELNPTADGILRHLSLLFVPAGVGVVQQLDRLGHDGLRLLIVIVLTTVISLTVTALVFAGTARLLSADDLSPEPPDDKAEETAA